MPKKPNTADVRYTVILDNCGNPDRGQDPSRRLPGTVRQVVSIADFAAASKACRDYIEENDLGGGNWTGGEIRENGKIVGRVAYNGTVWPPGEFAVGMKPLWPEPEAEPKPKDPLEWETSQVDTPFGPILIGGCFRIGNVKSIEGKFVVDGQHYEFMTFATFEEGGLKEIQSHNLLKNGVFSDTVVPPKKVPKKVKDAIRKAVARWASVPANMALIVRNEIKDQKKSIQHVERQIASYEQQLAKSRDELATHQAQIAQLEEKASQLESGS
ncbi:hypothetical protein [Microvirga sp. VF16]|uniref:hypothetical protein n=1 Tax=Microvirga sp. VF16 TaxID=2807101 RepID=UPI00193CA2FD|nr:hypothetical protein [Microvirga sp. VF16]QRM34780.1 hypothetical protein JO965_41695 [Microvirga sp. VF16]